MALRLLVDLYAKANIVEEGGVPCSIFFEDYTKARIADHKEFTVYGFTMQFTSVYKGNPVAKPHVNLSLGEDDQCTEFFNRVRMLVNTGAIYMVPTLFESDDGEVLFPLIDPFTQSEIPSLTCAAERMLPEDYEDVLEEYQYSLPILKHLTSATVKGVAVLRYRQQTKLTNAGYAATHERIRKWSETFSGGDVQYQGRSSSSAKVIQGNFGGKSRISP
jgi:hypothetical protein